MMSLYYDAFDYSECMDKFYSSEFSEYYQDFHDTMRRSEHRRYKHRKQSPQLDSRIKLVELARTVCTERFLSRTTLHLAIYILDQFMDVFEISHERLRMFSVVCVLIASKIEDRSECVPRWDDIQEFVDTKSNSGESREFRILECMILNSIHWRVVVPTAATFMEYYIVASITINDVSQQVESSKAVQLYKDLRLIMYNLIYYLLDLSLNEVDLIGMLPSKLSSASIMCARFLLSYEPIWTGELLRVTGYQMDDIMALSKKLLVLYKAGHSGQDDLKKTQKRRSDFLGTICPPEKLGRLVGIQHIGTDLL